MVGRALPRVDPPVVDERATDDSEIRPQQKENNAKQDCSFDRVGDPFD